MTITLTQHEQIAALIEYSEIMGFLLAFEEGTTSKERADSLAKKYPAITKIRDKIRTNQTDEETESDKPAKINGKKKPEPVITE